MHVNFRSIATFLLILFALFSIIFTISNIGYSFFTYIKTARFEQVNKEFDFKFLSGEIKIDAREVHLGEKTQPAYAIPSAVVPGWSGEQIFDTVIGTPRIFYIKGTCTYVKMTQGLTIIYAAAAFPDIDHLTIDVPQSTDGAINLCKRVGYAVSVIMWGR